MDDQVVERLRRFVEARDWEQFHTPKNLSMGLAAEAGELIACFQWLTETESEQVLADEERAGQVLDELGDVGIYLVMLCDRLGLTLSDIVTRKIEINEAKYPVDKARGRATKYTRL